MLNAILSLIIISSPSGVSSVHERTADCWKIPRVTDVPKEVRGPVATIVGDRQGYQLADGSFILLPQARWVVAPLAKIGEFLIPGEDRAIGIHGSPQLRAHPLVGVIAVEVSSGRQVFLAPPLDDEEHSFEIKSVKRWSGSAIAIRIQCQHRKGACQINLPDVVYSRGWIS